MDRQSKHKFGEVFKILVDGGYISFIDSIHCLQTCHSMYKKKRWFGNRRPMYKMISKAEYQKNKEQKKKDFWKRTKKYKKEKETAKAHKLYNSAKQPLLAVILRRITDEFTNDVNKRNWLWNKNHMYETIMDFRFVSVDVIPGTLIPYKKIVRILNRRSILRQFRKDVNQFVELHYPKLAVHHGTNPFVNRGSHDFGIQIWLNPDKRPPMKAVRSHRGGKKIKNKKGRRCPSCGGRHCW